MKKINKINIVLLIGITVLLFWFGHSYLNFTTEQIRNWILSFGLIAPVVFIVAYTIRPLVFFPASVLSLAGGLAFGTLWGTIYTVIGATMGVVLSFWIARHLGKNITQKNGKGNVAKIQHQLDKNGFYYVLMLRFIPLINFDLISYCAGISKVRFPSFFFGTLIGIIPGTFAYNFLGNSFVNSNPTIIATAIVVFIMLSVIPILVKKWLSRKSNLDLPEDDAK